MRFPTWHRYQANFEGGRSIHSGIPSGIRGLQAREDKSSAVPIRPTNVAIAPNGDIYVGDGYGSSFINQYNQQAEFIRTFGGLGKGDDQLDCPHGLWIDTREQTPLLVVADRATAGCIDSAWMANTSTSFWAPRRCHVICTSEIAKS